MILINQEEKDEVLKYFPNTKFYRTCKQKSKKHRYYMPELKDQLRFLSGIDKTQEDRGAGKSYIVIPGCKYINYSAVKAFEALLLNNIDVYSGKIGSPTNGYEILDETKVLRSIPVKKWCEYELQLVRKMYGAVL